MRWSKTVCHKNKVSLEASKPRLLIRRFLVLSNTLNHPVNWLQNLKIRNLKIYLLRHYTYEKNKILWRKFKDLCGHFNLEKFPKKVFFKRCSKFEVGLSDAKQHVYENMLFNVRAVKCLMSCPHIFRKHDLTNHVFRHF